MCIYICIYIYMCVYMCIYIYMLYIIIYIYTHNYIVCRTFNFTEYADMYTYVIHLHETVLC